MSHSENNTLHLFQLLADNYKRLLGELLTPPGMSVKQGAQWLYDEAPFGILAHNTAPDPVFIYGNRTVQRVFEYTWEELLKLPSRLSAEMSEQKERQEFLNRVTRDGFVAGYSGIRITKSGKRFRIENATIWQLIDARGNHCGQAARLPVMVADEQ